MVPPKYFSINDGFLFFAINRSLFPTIFYVYFFTFILSRFSSIFFIVLNRLHKLSNLKYLSSSPTLLPCFLLPLLFSPNPLLPPALSTCSLLFPNLSSCFLLLPPYCTQPCIVFILLPAALLFVIFSLYLFSTHSLTLSPINPLLFNSLSL